MREVEVVVAQVEQWGLHLSREQLASLVSYGRLLSGYREANVIGTRDLPTILLEHVLDSLSCFLFRPLRHVRDLADVGSGGGLPGLPLKLARPDLALTLIESTAKKARFLQHASRSLRLTGVQVINQRVESVSRAERHRARYGAVTARAVAPLAVLCEYCVPLLRIGGHTVAMKARLEDWELSQGMVAAEELGARVLDIVQVPLLPETGAKDRRLVILQKERETPSKYPRRPGLATKRPLGR